MHHVKVVIEGLKHGTLGTYNVIRSSKPFLAFAACNFVHEMPNYNYEAHNLAIYATSLGIGRHLCGWAFRMTLYLY